MASAAVPPAASSGEEAEVAALDRVLTRTVMTPDDELGKVCVCVRRGRGSGPLLCAPRSARCGRGLDSAAGRQHAHTHTHTSTAMHAHPHSLTADAPRPLCLRWPRRGGRAAERAPMPNLTTELPHRRRSDHLRPPHQTPQLLVKLLPALVQKLATTQPKIRAKVGVGVGGATHQSSTSAGALSSCRGRFQRGMSRVLAA